jgi:Xaa-Pro dipeptidase
MNKRDFLKVSVAAGVTATLTHPATAAVADTPDPLQNMTGNAVPISVGERKARVAKAQRLMQAAGIDALVIEAGSALVYFTGVRCGAPSVSPVPSFRPKVSSVSASPFG